MTPVLPTAVLIMDTAEDDIALAGGGAAAPADGDVDLTVDLSSEEEDSEEEDEEEEEEGEQEHPTRVPSSCLLLRACSFNTLATWILTLL